MLLPAASVSPPHARPLSRALRLSVLAGALLAAAPALADDEEGGDEGLAGTSRVTVLGGWQRAPNGALLERAAAAGQPLGRASHGGPALLASFAYAPSDLLDIAVDLFGSGAPLWRSDAPAAVALAYGALLGVRAQWLTGPVGPFSHLQPALGLHTGPTVVDGLEGQTLTEGVTQAWAASAALTGRLGGRWGLSLEYRYVLAQGQLAGRGPFNAGGHWLLAGFTYSFPRQSGPSGFHP